MLEFLVRRCIQVNLGKKKYTPDLNLDKKIFKYLHICWGGGAQKNLQLEGLDETEC